MGEYTSKYQFPPQLPDGIQADATFLAAPELFTSSIDSPDEFGMHDGSNFVTTTQRAGLQLQAVSIRDLRGGETKTIPATITSITGDLLTVITEDGRIDTFTISAYRFEDRVTPESWESPANGWTVFAKTNNADTFITLDLLPGSDFEESKRTTPKELPPHKLWTLLPVMMRDGDRRMERDELVPFTTNEVRAIAAAKNIVNLLSTKGEVGSDGIMRDFWSSVDGAGFGDGFLPNSALVGNRENAVNAINSAKSDTERCIRNYQDLLVRYHGQLGNEGEIRRRMHMLYAFKDLLTQVVADPQDS